MTPVEVVRSPFPPLYSWVRVRRTPTGVPIVGFVYRDPDKGPSVKGHAVRDESDARQIALAAEQPNATIVLPGLEWEPIAADRARKIGLPDLPGWFLRSFDDGTAHLFADAADPTAHWLADQSYLKVARTPGSLGVEIVSAAAKGETGGYSPAAIWKRLRGRSESPAPSAAQGDSSEAGGKLPPALASLQATAARGRLIARLDRLSVWATDALNALAPQRSRPESYLAYRGESAWCVAFGELAADGSAFQTRYEAVSTGPCGWPFDIHVFDPPRDDTGWLREAARALALSRKEPVFSSDADAYNYVVIPESAGGNSVYWYPATTTPGVELIGADCRVLVASDGTITLERYHQSLLRSEPGEPFLAHTHVLIPDPVPLDVATVLLRRPQAPSLIISRDWTFLLTRQGTIVPIDLAKDIEVDAGLVGYLEATLTRTAIGPRRS